VYHAFQRAQKGCKCSKDQDLPFLLHAPLSPLGLKRLKGPGSRNGKPCPFKPFTLIIRHNTPSSWGFRRYRENRSFWRCPEKRSFRDIPQKGVFNGFTSKTPLFGPLLGCPFQSRIGPSPGHWDNGTSRHYAHKGLQGPSVDTPQHQIPDGMHNGTEYHGFGRRDILASRDGRERCPEKGLKTVNTSKKGLFVIHVLPPVKPLKRGILPLFGPFWTPFGMPPFGPSRDYAVSLV